MALRISIVRTKAADAPNRRRRRWTVAAATVVAGVLLSGVSYAYWTATGGGTATVGSVTAVPLGITPGALADLYPGKPVEAITFTVTNTNPYAVVLGSPTLGTVTSNSEGTCGGAANLTVTPGPYTFAGAPVTVPASGSISVSINNFVQMKTTALDACQTKVFNFPFTLTGTQQ
ncbi:MAG: hypothetical protein QOE84_2825 [Actinomycetota bacterium]|jgi:hypothetical protein|nr:hypothetical protein [Actinomycetota bacterium]